MSIALTEPMNIRPQRIRDRCIMEVLLGCFSENELKNINKVRISIQLLTLGDITMQTGRTILPNIYKAISHRKFTLCWPRQPLVKKFFHYGPEPVNTSRVTSMSMPLAIGHLHTKNGNGPPIMIIIYSNTIVAFTPNY